jgi:hypothetical protein
MALSKRRMTAAEFDAITPMLHISRERIDAARAALVDGHTQQSIATPRGWTRQAVNDAVNAVWKKLNEFQAAQSKSASSAVLLPPGWEQVTLIAPRALIEKFRAELAEYVAPSQVAREKSPIDVRTRQRK